MALALLFGLFFSYMYYKNLKRIHNKIIVTWGIFQKESCMIAYVSSLRKKLTLPDATVGFPANCRLRNEWRYSMLMTCQYPDLGTAFDWIKQIFNQSEASGWCTSSVWNFCACFSDVISKGKPLVATILMVFSWIARITGFHENDGGNIHSENNCLWYDVPEFFQSC